MDLSKFNKDELNIYLDSEISKIKDIKDIVRINFWWIYFELIKKILNDSLQLEKDNKKKMLLKLTLLTELINKTTKDLYNSRNEIYRKINEIKIDVINRYLEEHTIYAEENKILLNNDTDFEYYPEYSDNLFNKKTTMFFCTQLTTLANTTEVLLGCSILGSYGGSEGVGNDLRL